MAPKSNGLEEEPSHFLSDSPDQLSLAEGHEEEQEAGSGGKTAENGHADGPREDDS